MGKRKRMVLGKKINLLMTCMVLAFLLDKQIVQAEETPTLYEQVYQSNVEIYNNAPKDQDTLNYYLEEEISEDIKNKAIEVTADCTTNMEKLQAIHDWIANNIYYDYYGRSHDTVEYLSKEVYEKKGTICAGYANLTASMCRAVGIPCKVIQGFALGEGTIGYWTQDNVNSNFINHAWNEAYVDGKWVILDTTWDSKNGNTDMNEKPSYNNCQQVYFNLTLEKFSNTHKLVDKEVANVDMTEYRNVDENLKLNITISDGKIIFDWNEIDGGINYELQFNVIDGDAYGIDYSTGAFACVAKGLESYYEESVVPYNTNGWPIYFRVRMVKDDGTIWYSQRIEYYPPRCTVTFMDGETVVSTQVIYIGESATAPQLVKEGYDLSWEGSYTNVQTDVTIKAVWTAKPVENEDSTKDEQKNDEKLDEGQADDKQPTSEENLPEVGAKETLSGGQYKVTKSSSDSKEVTFVKPKSSKKTSVSIPATVKIDGYTYKVTEIAAKAFKNNKKIKSVTISKNVKKIGKEAFCNCKKLKKVTIKGSGLKSVGKNAIKNIDKKATIKVPKNQLSKYKGLFKSKTGYKKTMKIKK